MAADIFTRQGPDNPEEHDAAWIDLQDELHWIHDDQEFLWLSERDGWQHIYRVDRTGKQTHSDHSRRFRRDRARRRGPESDWVYFIASPDNPTQRYLYRVHLDGRAANG